MGKSKSSIEQPILGCQVGDSTEFPLVVRHEGCADASGMASNQKVIRANQTTGP